MKETSRKEAKLKRKRVGPLEIFKNDTGFIRAGLGSGSGVATCKEFRNENEHKYEYKHERECECEYAVNESTKSTERAATQSVRKPTGPDFKPKEVIIHNLSEEEKSQTKPQGLRNEHRESRQSERAHGVLTACSGKRRASDHAHDNDHELDQSVHAEQYSKNHEGRVPYKSLRDKVKMESKNQLFPLFQESLPAHSNLGGDMSEKVLLYILDQGETNLIKIRYQDLSLELGCSVSTLRRALNKLKCQKYIETFSSAGRPGVGIRLIKQSVNTLEQTYEHAYEQTDEHTFERVHEKSFKENPNISRSSSEDFDQKFKMEKSESKIEIEADRETEIEIEKEMEVRKKLENQNKANSAESNEGINREILHAAQELEKRIKQQAMKNLGLSFFLGNKGSNDSKLESRAKFYTILFEFLLLFVLTVVINFIMIKFSAIYFSKVEKIPGVSGGLVFSVLEAFTIYLSATMTRSRGIQKIMKLGAILTLIGLSLGLMLKGSWDSLNEKAIKSHTLNVRAEEIRQQISTLDRRIEGYLEKEWRSAALKLEQEKLALMPELSALTKNQSAVSGAETFLLSESGQKKQFLFMIALRVILELINVFCCSRLGEIIFKELSFSSIFAKGMRKIKEDSDVYARV